MMKVNIRCCKAWHVYIMYIQIYFSSGMGKGRTNRWLIGRTPPSIFEYSGLNGFYSPKQAQSICETDLQCGGFTFKGSKKIKYTIPEVYFFHFINESSSYLTTDIKYPHWTSYIIGSRDHIVVSGSYPSPNGTDCHRLIRYDNFFQTIVFCLNNMQICGVPTFMFMIVLEIFRLMNCSETCLGTRSEP